MKRFSRFFVVIVFSVFACTVFSQPVNNAIGDVTVASPNVAAMNKYTDIPVSTFTGIPSVSIPIHTIQEGPISVPISLSYHPGGIKLGETASWVGLGWSLSAGGMVNRSVIGSADDRQDGKGYINGDYKNLTEAQIMAGGYDTEADIFYFNFGGYSGKLMWSHSDVDWHVYPKSDLKVTTNNGNQINEFIFTTPTGLVYTFGTGDETGFYVEKGIFSKSIALPPDPMTTNAWYLKRIDGPNNLYFVEFNYVNERYRFPFISSNESTLLFGGIGGGNDCSGSANMETVVETIYSHIYGKRLSSITTGTQKEQVSFIPSSINRRDLDVIQGGQGAEAKSLERIEIQSGAFCKAFFLDQSYTNDSDNNSENKRLILHKVQETICGSTEINNSGPIPPYEFSYEGGLFELNNLPDRLSKQIDHWGYYNGAESNDSKLTLIPYTASVTYLGEVYYYGDGDPNIGADRASNGEYMKKGVLNRIDYPTGGSTEFEFSANQEFRLRDAKDIIVENQATNCTNYPSFPNHIDPPVSFTLNELSTAEYLIKLDLTKDETYGCTDCANTIDRFRTRIKAKMVDDSAPQQIHSYSNYIEVQAYTCDGDFDLQTIYGYNSVQSDFYPPLTPDKLYEFEIEIGGDTWTDRGSVEFKLRINPEVNTEVGGLRVDRITNHPISTNGEIIVTNYNYNETTDSGQFIQNAKSTGRVLIEPQYGFIFNSVVINENGPNNSVLMRRYSSSPLVNTTDINGYFFGYKKVTTTKGNQVSTYNHTAIKVTTTGFPVVNSYPPIYNNGSLDKRLSVNQSGSNSQLVNTGEIVPFAVNTYNNQIKFYKLDIQCADGTGQPVTVTIYRTVQSYLYDPSYYRTIKTEESLDGVGKTTFISYDAEANHTMPIQSRFLNSDGKMHKTISHYPPNLDNSTNPANASMVQKNMIGIPIIVENFVDDVLVSGQKTKFNDFGNSTLPFEAIEIYADGSERTMITLDYNNGKIETVDRLGAPLERYTWANDLPESKTIEVANAPGEDWTWNYSFYSDTKFLESITDLNGQVTSYTYDDFFRLQGKSEREGLVNTSYQYIYMNPGQIGSINKVIQSTEFSDDTPPQSSEQQLDGLGRPVANLINGINKEEMFYNHMGQIVQQTYLPGVFKDITYEASPLSRPIGEIYPDGSFIGISYGNQGQYYAKTITDENGNPTTTLTDIIGQHIQTTDALGGTTAYQYDDIGNLTTVTAPDGSSYSYTYDLYNRLIEKTIPGGGTHEFLYNSRDLMVASRDENLTGDGRWLGTTYDVAGRPIETGFIDNAGIPDPENLGTINPLSQTFYDYYSNLPPNTNLPLTAGCSGGSTLGAAVGTKVFLLNGKDPDPTRWTETVNCLDNFGRAEKTLTGNHLEGVDQYLSTYDLADNLLVQNRLHFGGPIIEVGDPPQPPDGLEIIEHFEYDNFFRPLMNWHQVNLADGTIGENVLISHQSYNDLDQLEGKVIYGPGSSNPLQSIDYAYNVRGWLTHINDVPEGGDDVNIPDCDDEIPTECGPVCDYTATLPHSGNDKNTIIGIYVKGDLLMDLDYPLGASASVLENEIETWLWDNSYVFESVNVIIESGSIIITITGSSIVFNKVRHVNGEVSMETFFRRSNCDRPPTQNPPSICDLCERDGYKCDKCPYWEQEEDPCTTCQYFGISDCTSCTFVEDICTRCTNLGYPDCSSCPLTVDRIKPLRIVVEYNQGELSSSNPNSILVRVSDESIKYLHDGTARLRTYQNMAAVGQGDLISLGAGTYANLMEISFSDEIIIESTLDSIIASTESMILDELINAGISNPIVQSDFIDAVIAEATSTWTGTTDTPTDIPGNTTGGNNPDLFSMELYYSENHPMVSSSPQYNGNIAGMIWKTGFGAVNSYSFEYDAINRLSSGLFKDDIGGGNYAVDNKYGVSLTYDAIGNIQTLTRRGVDDACENPQGGDPLYEFTQIDNLQYTYQNNRLESIAEASNQLKGFKGAGGIYSYDGNGNMTDDQNKGMVAAYNHLNLPYNIGINSTNSINFTYDAAGTKLQKQATGQEDGEQVDNTTDYIGGIEYKNGTIEAIYHSEGRVVFKRDDESGTIELNHEYYLKDHLGNVRVVFSDLNKNGYLEPFNFDPDVPILQDPLSYEPNELIQENHYYPFGMEMEGPWELSVSSPENKYLFNGIEHASDFGLDWDMAMFRSYDPAIGRWLQVDPFAEFAHDWTPYRFGFNNPMMYSDPLGLFESKKAARRYRRKERRAARKAGKRYRASIVKSKQGRYELHDKDSNGYITQNEDGTFDGGAVADKVSDNSKEPSNLYSRPPRMGTWEADVYYAKVTEDNKYVWYYHGSKTQYVPPGDPAEAVGRMFSGIGMLRFTYVAPKSKDVLGHIFRKATGHVKPATAASRARYLKLFEKVANSGKVNANVLTNFQRMHPEQGFKGFSYTFRSGKQVWVATKNGKIINAGVNKIAK